MAAQLKDAQYCSGRKLNYCNCVILCPFCESQLTQRYCDTLLGHVGTRCSTTGVLLQLIQQTCSNSTLIISGYSWHLFKDIPTCPTITRCKTGSPQVGICWNGGKELYRRFTSFSRITFFLSNSSAFSCMRLPRI